MRHVCCSMVAALLGLYSTVQAQPMDTVYVVFNYMKAADGKRDAYVDLERNVWKAIHQARIRNGLLTAWYFYEVDSDVGSPRDYDFVTVDVYDSFSKLENPYPASLFADAELAKKVDNTGKLRDLVRSDIWRGQAAAMGKRRQDGSIALVHYMQPAPDKTGDYVVAETTAFQKFHQAAIDSGAMNAWFFLSRRFPQGSSIPYQFVTINVFDNQKEADAAWQDESRITKVFEGLANEQQELVKSIDSLRTIVKQDTWKLIDSVHAQ